MTSFLRWSMQTKWYGKSRNGVSFDRLACNRQKEALFLMSFGLCDKNETASCGYKSQPLSAWQEKKLGCIVLKNFKAYCQGFFLAVP